MADRQNEDSTRDERLDDIVADFLRRVSRGETPVRPELLAAHPEFADDLRSFFAEHDKMQALADAARGNEALAATPDSLDAPTLLPDSQRTEDFARSASRAKPAAPPLGTVIRYFGDYELLAEIARGGMGVVYKARQKKLNRIVALKMILAGQLASKADVQRFYSEAESAAQLDHPGIVPIFEVGEHDGQHFFSMGYVDGPSLSHRIADSPLPPREAAELLRSVALAVQYAHDKGVIHRDLKPANILLQLERTGNAEAQSRQGAKRESTSDQSLRAFAPLRLGVNYSAIKVTDFGLAKQVKGDSGLTATGQILGTPSYMPPEQAAGRLDQVKETADVYSLGAVLYATLTGRPPFQADNPLDTLLQVLEREPVSPRQQNPSVPKDLETICLKCLEKDRRRRYQSAQDVAAELQRYLNGEPILARPSTAWDRAFKWAKRRPAIASLIAAVLITLVTGTAVSTYFAFEASDQARVAVTQKNRADDKAKEAKANADLADQKADEALANSERADRNARRADDEAKVARRGLYVSHMNLAQVAWENNQVGRIMELLNEHNPKSGEEDLRGFEWQYWSRLVNSFQMSCEGHSDAVYSVAFSPDGKRLASASADQTVKVWDATSGQEMLTLKGHTGEVTSVAFSPDGKRLASGGSDTVKVWDATSGQELLTLIGHTQKIVCVAYSPNGKQLATASYDQMVKVWDAIGGKETFTLNGHTNVVTSVTFSPDGKQLATGSYDETVKVWDATNGHETLTLKGRNDPIGSVAFTPDGKRLAAGSGDRHAGDLRVWDATTGEETLTLKGHTGMVDSVAFSADGKRLASGSWDGNLKVWDATTGEETLTLKVDTRGTTMAFSPDGKRLASARDHTVKVWDATSSQESLTLKGHTNLINCVAFSADGKRLASVTGDPYYRVTPGEVKVWDTASGQEMLTLNGHTEAVSSVTFSKDGKWLATSSWDQTVKVWDATSGQATITLKGHTVGVRSVAFSPDGKRLASASDDGVIKVWDARSGQEVQTLHGHTDPVNCVVFSSDGTRLASAAGVHYHPPKPGEVKVWDAVGGQETLALKGHTAGVMSVTFSPDGKRLASASNDQTVKVWDATSGQKLLTLNGHTGAVTSVAFSPDGKRLASASVGDTVKVWDAASGQETLTLNGHTYAVTSVAFSADGNRLASASIDQTVKVWDARPWTPELRVEQEALSLVRFYAVPPITKDELLARIRADSTISEPVRERGLEFAREWKLE